MGNTAKKIEQHTAEVAINDISQAALSLEWAMERIHKIERIKAEVQDGTYKIDTTAVAAAIFSRKEI